MSRGGAANGRGRDGAVGRRPAARSATAGRGTGKAAGQPRAAGDLLNRTAAVPLYYQLEEVLERRILSGVWAPHQRLPSERELCDEFAVSRAVVRPALEILERQGRIIRVEGSGTFVAPPKSLAGVHGIVSLFSAPIDEETEVVIIDASEKPAEAEVARALGVDATKPLLHVSARVAENDRPRCLAISTIAMHRVPWLGPLLRPNARLRGCGPFGDARLETFQLEIETGSCTDFEAEQLGLTPGSSVFNVRLIDAAQQRQSRAPTPVESAWLIYPTDSVCLRVAGTRTAG